MFKRSMVGAAFVLVLLGAATAQAQENATLVLKSGERVSGELLDHGGVGFTIRVNNQERQIPTHEVAVLEFANPGNVTLNDEWRGKLSGGQHVVQLRSGETLAGNFYDIGGTRPLRITVDTPSGRRDFNSTDVARIYLSGEGAGAVGTTMTTQPAEPGAIVVPANQQWVATGLTVRRGETVNFRSSGQIQLSADANDRAQVTGAFGGRRAAGAPMPNILAGALIGRIGNGQPFAIGDQASIPMPASGPLYLGINDDVLNDNQGQFQVVVQQTGRRR
jgi:hypothetical protein